ncbi:MAG: ABC transporter permease [Acidobacteria bacterium]|nr:MAG: ABC transporter permease [Acidobacteriota bacterium]
MNGVLAIARCDLQRLLQDRSGLIWTFLMPVVFAAFFGLAFTGGSDPTTARAYLTVVDEDQGPLARRLVTALEAGQLELNVVAPDQRPAKPVRTLVIPAGFSRRVLAGETVTLRLEKEPETNEPAALVAQARIVGAIARLLADLVAASTAGDGTLSPEALERLDAGDDLVRVEARYAGRVQRVPSGFRHSLPGNAVMFVMLIALTHGAGSLAGERRNGTLRRLATAPLSRAEILGGKLAGRLGIALVQITFFVLTALAARAFFGFDVGDDPLGLWLVLAVYALTVAPLGLLFGGLIRDPDHAANAGALTTLGMAGLGGCWWPIEVVPEAMQRLALLLPTGWAMRALHQVVAFGNGLAAAVPSLLVLAAFAALFAAVAVRTLRLT